MYCTKWKPITMEFVYAFCAVIYKCPHENNNNNNNGNKGTCDPW